MENAKIFFTVIKIGVFTAFAVVALLAIKEPTVIHSTEARVAETRPAVDDIVVARVNGHDVYRSDFMTAYVQLPPQAQQMGIEVVYSLLLERVIDEKLLAIAAVDAIAADDAEVVSQVDQLRERVMVQVYFARQLEAEVTDTRIRDGYERYLAENPPVAEVHARHVLLETEEKANEVLVEIWDGKDFVEAAKEYSTGPSGPSGGDLGYFTADGMVKPFSDAAFAMEAGEISSQPVQTEFGWHLIKLEDRREQPQPAFEEMREQISQELAQAVASGIIGELREGATIEKFDIDGNPMSTPESAAMEGEQPTQQ